MSDRGLLSLAITAAYPTERFKRVVRGLELSEKRRIARLLERDESIPSADLRTLFFPELLDEAARHFSRVPPGDRLYPMVSVACWRLYGHLAGRALRRTSPAQVYIFRAGFGGASIDRARELGMVTLCDHALAHPSLLGELVDNRGVLRDGAIGEPSRLPISPPPDRISRAVLSDIDQSDAVLVNSDFVKDTFLTAGWPEDRIHVVYLGVDDNFLQGMRVTRRDVQKGPLPLLFAGRLERRKGADVLINALREVRDEVDWKLFVAGPVTPDIHSEHRAFFSNDRVKLLGTVRRSELRAQMLSAPVFVFPSYAEGSARAVFEALACGCYVITTANSGTIVQDGIHGALVPPGDDTRLAAAIVDADRDRVRIAEIGSRNAQVIAAGYRQVDYGDALASVCAAVVRMR